MKKIALVGLIALGAGCKQREFNSDSGVQSSNRQVECAVYCEGKSDPEFTFASPEKFCNNESEDHLLQTGLVNGLPRCMQRNIAPLAKVECGVYCENNPTPEMTFEAPENVCNDQSQDKLYEMGLVNGLPRCMGLKITPVPKTVECGVFCENKNVPEMTFEAPENICNDDSQDELYRRGLVQGLPRCMGLKITPVQKPATEPTVVPVPRPTLVPPQPTTPPNSIRCGAYCEGKNVPEMTFDAPRTLCKDGGEDKLYELGLVQGLPRCMGLKIAPAP